MIAAAAARDRFVARDSWVRIHWARIHGFAWDRLGLSLGFRF